ncbi:MAG TPA: hypothetical protein VIW73_04760 [Candidatus Cybelea sp.]
MVALFAVGISAALFVYCGSAIAPRFRRYVRYTLTAAVLTPAIYYVITASVEGVSARPAVLTGLAAVAGVICAYAAARGDVTESGSEMFGWMPGTLRWVAFIPVAFVLSLIAGYAIGLPLSLLPLNTQQFVPLVTTPVFTAAFVGVAEAVAPRNKRIVGLTLSSLTAVIVIMFLWVGLVQAVNGAIVPIYVYAKPDERALSITVWHEVLMAAACLAGLAIASAAVFRRSK